MSDPPCTDQQIRSIRPDTEERDFTEMEKEKKNKKTQQRRRALETTQKFRLMNRFDCRQA